MSTTDNINKINFGALPLSLDVLKNARIGLWAFELEEGKPPRMYGDESMMELLGIQGKVTPEEMYHAWYDNVDENHYDAVDEAVENMCQGSAEVQYPWHYQDGRTIIVRCGGRRNPRYTKGLRIEGVHRDVTDLAHFEKEKELQKLVEEEKKIIDNFSTAYNIVYRVNLNEDIFDMIRMDPNMIGASLEFETMSDALNYFVRNVLYQPDREYMTEEVKLEHIRKRLEVSPLYSVPYRVILKDFPIWHEMIVRKLDENTAAIAFAVRGNEAILTSLHKMVNDDYFVLMAADCDSGLLNIIKKSPWDDFFYEGEIVDYKVGIKRIENSLVGEAKDYYKRLGNMNHVIEKLANEDKLTFSYKSPRLIGNNWVNVTVYAIKRHMDGTPAVFTIGLGLMDTMGVDREEIQEQLKDALDRAESANEAKTSFLFNMSHDIRTPMNAIMGFTDMAIRKIDDKEKVRDCLEKVKDSSSLLLSLINGVLDMSRIESGKAEIEENPGDVYLAFSSFEDSMQELASQKDIKLTFEFGDIKDRFIYCDFNRCVRIMVNLISNAIKYTGAGGHVNVKCEQDGNYSDGRGIFKFTVSDNGIGMSEEFISHAFDAYAREKNSTTSGIQGTGLGLTVCKTFAEAMGGSIECQSKQGEGSTFIVTIPMKVQAGEMYVNPATGRIVSAEEEAADTIDFSGMRVLLVEDNDLNREIATDLLEEEDIIVDEAINGAVAVKTLEAKGPDYYDFILMDIQMPVMNGYEATKAIRLMYPDAKVPIIALSANAFSEDRQMSMENGMDEHIAKPIDAAKLKVALSRFM